MAGAVAGAVAGGVLLLAAAVWPAGDAASPTAPVPPTVGAAPSDVAAPARPGPRSSAGTRRPPSPPPVRLEVPALSVDAPVVPVGVDEATGGMEIPEDVGLVGWYRFGPGLDATQGSTVLAGHVDRAGQEGALFDLRDLDPEATLTATGPDGRARSYVVVARDQWSKSRVPLEELFARDGPPRLVVITCGGPFDPVTRSYRDNLVITAVPSGAP